MLDTAVFGRFNMDICAHLNKANVKDSFYNQLIYKDECMKCFSNPESEEGLNVCLGCLQGFWADMGHTQQHYTKTHHPIVLNIKKIPKDPSVEENKITKLAIGKDGGANINEHFDVKSSLHCLEWNKELNPNGEFISPIIDSVLNSKSAFFQSQIGEWEQEIKEWPHVKCLDQTGWQQIACKELAHWNEWELKSNLWLCMSWGNLGCGRQQHGGVSGNNHAIMHYQSNDHPVVCKIGTITPQGTASLFWYLWDEDVEDKKLGEHLQTLGIDMGIQIKTEKTMTEINLEMNLALTLSKIVEEGRTLTPVFGPCFTGMVNLGNSCYLNSVMQVLFSNDRILDHFYNMYEDHHLYWNNLTTEWYDCQVSKLAFGIKSGRYSQKKECKKQPHELMSEEEKNQTDIYQDGVRPQSFKNLIGKGHHEFSSGRQQDAQEYLQYILDKIEKEENTRGRVNPCKMFEFDIEHRYQCANWQGVAYIKERTNQINLFIVSQENTDMIPETEELSNCIERYFGDEIVNKDCPKCNSKQDFNRRTRFLNFPEVLIVATQRFTYLNWTPTKVQTSLNMILNDLNLENFKASGGIQPGEVELPDGTEVEVEIEAEINQDLLNMCLMMGLPELPAKHALLNTGNSDADSAVTWYFSNMENPDINGPLPTIKKLVKTGGFGKEEKKESAKATANEEVLGMLVSMGMDEARSRKCLIKFDNNFDAALDYMTSCPPEDDNFGGEEEKKDAVEWQVDQREGVYNLDSFITHLGKFIHSGHYVAHIRKGNDWVLFNDHKVAITSDPPFDKAFIYFYRKK